MLQRLRESLALLLLALLPFHALLITLATKVIAGAGHAPMGILAGWKEGVLALIVGLAVAEIIRGTGDLPVVSRVEPRIAARKIDAIDWIIVTLIALSVVVTASTHHNWPLYALGFKYDFLPLAAFLILRRVPWSDGFLLRVMHVVAAMGALLSLYGIITFFLPARFFTALGYSDLHSLYVPGGPLAAFQQIGGSGVRRIQSTMSGPNQFGIWLLIPWAAVLATVVRRGLGRRMAQKTGVIVTLALMGLALLLTFSRSAWIGAFLILVMAVGSLLPRRAFWTAAGSVTVLSALAVIACSFLVPSVFFRLASSRDHFLKPLEAIQSIAAHPLGQGLGTAGPASNRVSDACVYLDAGADTSWAKTRQDLCVFVGGIKTQPVSRDCHCPFIPENWYLQIGVETGVLGLILYLALTLLVLYRAYAATRKSASQSALHQAFVWTAFLAFAGTALTALFLHAWEDAAVAYMGWVLLAVAVHSVPDTAVQKTFI